MTKQPQRTPSTRSSYSVLSVLRDLCGYIVVFVLFCAAVAPHQAATQTSRSSLHDALDEILDLYVRDGRVYYYALKQERATFDRYVANLASSAALEAARASKAQEMAFWINAYNALVLKTVIDHYPVRGKSDKYPADSIRQIPGAFERITHRAGGRTITLDEIEKTVLPAFQDPRVYLALGRGAVGSGRLLSEAYRGDRLEAQLKLVHAEMVQRPELFRVDTLTNDVAVTPIVGWHEAEFVAAFASGVSQGFSPALQKRFEERSPIERAILAFVEPHLVPNERAFLSREQFSVKYLELDWHLNDLTGR